MYCSNLNTNIEIQSPGQSRTLNDIRVVNETLAIDNDDGDTNGRKLNMVTQLFIFKCKDSVRVCIYADNRNYYYLIR